jgi:prephenate dehydrogenase
LTFDRVIVCGVGLIGGSFALALKAAGAVGEVIGFGRTQAPLQEAVRLGVIDRIGRDWTEAGEADLVLLGMPVGQMEPVMRALAPHVGARTIITDGGSTKADVVAAARAAFGNRVDRFVPGHPIAGAEKSGVAAATADLYRDKRVVLTPLPENQPDDVTRVRTAWETCGARVSELAADEHDRVFAAVSHLPHLLAYALVHDLAMRENSDQLFGFAAGGFRDFTRIASSHPEMWRDICLANRRALAAELDAYMAELMRTRVLLASGDGAALEVMFATARSRRDAWLDSLQPPSGE